MCQATCVKISLVRLFNKIVGLNMAPFKVETHCLESEAAGAEVPVMFRKVGVFSFQQLALTQKRAAHRWLLPELNTICEK